MRRKNTVAKVGKHVASFAEQGEPRVVEDAAAPRSQPQPTARGPPELEELFTVDEAAAILRCSKASLDKWRLTGQGPKFIYVGRRVRYTRAALIDFIDKSTRRSTSDTGKNAATAA